MVLVFFFHDLYTLCGARTLRLTGCQFFFRLCEDIVIGYVSAVSETALLCDSNIKLGEHFLLLSIQ